MAKNKHNYDVENIEKLRAFCPAAIKTITKEKVIRSQITRLIALGYKPEDFGVKLKDSAIG